MVRKEKIPVPPVCVAFPALAVFLYALVQFNWGESTIVLSMAALLPLFFLVHSFQALHRLIVAPQRTPVIPRYIKVLFFSAIVSLALYSRIRIEEQTPKSLLPIHSVQAIEAILLEDPVPAGNQWYRAHCELISFIDEAGSIYSARGSTCLLLPSTLIRENLPYGLTGTKHSQSYYRGMTVRLCGTWKEQQLSSNVGLAFFAYEAVPENRSAFIIRQGMQSKPRKDGVFSRFRAKLRYHLIRYLGFMGPEGGLFLALVSGSREYLDPALAQDFRKAGLSHILALSGMHLSLFASLALFICRRFCGKRVSPWIALVVMASFFWFAGNSPSLIRAMLMASLVLAAKKAGYASSLLSILCLAGVIQLCIEPSHITSLAFLLSYSALAGILALSPTIITLIRPCVPTLISAPLSASVSAQLATMPLCAFLIGSISPLAIPASIIVSPIASLFLVSSLVLVPFGALVPPCNSLTRGILTLLYTGTQQSVSFFARVPVLTVQDLFGASLVSILSLSVIIALHALAQHWRLRRSCDVLFTRL